MSIVSSGSSQPRTIVAIARQCRVARSGRAKRQRHSELERAFTPNLFSDVLVTAPDSLSNIRGVQPTFGAVIVDTIDDVLIKVLADSPLELDARQRRAVLSLLRTSVCNGQRTMKLLNFERSRLTRNSNLSPNRFFFFFFFFLWSFN